MSDERQPVTLVLRSKDPVLMEDSVLMVNGVPVAASSLHLDAAGGQVTEATLELVPWDGMDLELPAHVTINVVVDPGHELLVSDTIDGEKRYVCRAL